MGKRTKSVKLTDIKGKKPWLIRAGITAYKVNTKNPNKTFLIVCEGQTEALYFKSFPTISAEVKTYDMGCANNVLVDSTIGLAENSDYDEVWCVFDMDYKGDVNGQADDFNSAIQKCVANDIRCAYSNDAFELWVYLHFQFTDQQHHRKFYYEKLGEIFGINYVREGKKRKFCLGLYGILNSLESASQASAIERAKTLEGLVENIPPHQQNPITTVHSLVEELNKFLSS